MILRFLPDTWRDALLRPLAMGAPDAGVYVEIMAPDWRFAAVLLLGFIALVVWRKRLGTATPIGVLALWLLAAFVVWIATSGNGRYFMPGLLVVGPLCVALAARLPGTPQLRVAIAAGLVVVQGWVVLGADPWSAWSLGTWEKAPFFEVQVDQEGREEPATYVSISSISYSLIAPQFHPESRWVNISSLPDASQSSPDGRRLAALLQQSKAIRMVAPSRPDFMTAEGLPNPALRDVMNDILASQRLRLAEPLRCRLLPSRGLATVGARVDRLTPAMLEKMGFWICDAQYPARARKQPDAQADVGVTQVFDQVERKCPRFYQPGQTSASRVNGGWVRMYPQADIRLYVMDDGNVYYKYWRALNPVLLGQASEIKAGAAVNCESVRGRTGLPWEREI